MNEKEYFWSTSLISPVLWQFIFFLFFQFLQNYSFATQHGPHVWSSKLLFHPNIWCSSWRTMSYIPISSNMTSITFTCCILVPRTRIYLEKITWWYSWPIINLLSVVSARYLSKLLCPFIVLCRLTLCFRPQWCQAFSSFLKIGLLVPWRMTFPSFIDSISLFQASEVVLLSCFPCSISSKIDKPLSLCTFPYFHFVSGEESCFKAKSFAPVMNTLLLLPLRPWSVSSLSCVTSPSFLRASFQNDLNSAVFTNF